MEGLNNGEKSTVEETGTGETAEIEIHDDAPVDEESKTSAKTSPEEPKNVNAVIAQPQTTPPPAVQAAAATTETPQQEFDRLAARKDYLWKQIQFKASGIRENTPEQQEIDQIDERLMELWKTGSVTRKED